MRKPYLLIFALLCLGLNTTQAQYKVLHSFNDTNGANPTGSLTLAGNKLYGMTNVGGAYNAGCIFSIDTNGNSYKILLDFNDTNGANPYGSLILSGNVLYGMTSSGTNFDGNIFSIDTNGNNFKSIWSFSTIDDSNGAAPNGSLILSGKVLYGMTGHGGLNGNGNIFSINTNGTNYKDLLDFNGTNGNYPSGDLILLGNILYGMTPRGGVHSEGNIFSLDTNGSNYKDLWDFSNAGDSNGTQPLGSLTISGNKFYGTTYAGGRNSWGNIFSIDVNGGGYKDLFDFNFTNGYAPMGNLTLWGGELYGIMPYEGANNNGYIFSIDTSGNSYKDLFDFSNNKLINGNQYPANSLILSGNVFYGMTEGGGAIDSNSGVIFSFKDINIVSINELAKGSGGVSIFPNPNNGLFTIQSNTAEVNSTVAIYNMLGEKIYTQPLRQAQGDNSIDLSNSPSGIYLYRVLTETGNLISSGKFVIQK
ncbi:MAG TPA: T9SS type A sorting domain-containing protein [Bacteroidia bacterium]|nr:T9SS type A sorting domain-containing protein [Bacteroidia bacterium]